MRIIILLFVIIFQNCIVLADDTNTSQNPDSSNSSADDETTTKSASPSTSSAKSLKLYGRIEEICAQPGAKIPIKLQSMKGKLDTSTALSGQAIQARATSSIQTNRVASFPTDWSGFWSGNLQIYTRQFDQICWQFDAEEANQEVALLQPGVVGQASFNFTRDSQGKIYLEPTKFIFNGYKDVSKEMAQYRDSISKMFGSQSGQSPFGQMFGGGNSFAPMTTKIPATYVMWFGDLEPSRGVTGNTLQSRVVKNDIRQLGPSVLEQVIVTSEADRNATTGKVRNSYAESVLRFQVQSANQLYVQAAKVNYTSNGKFMNKVVLYGTVSRNTNARSGQSPYGYSNTPSLNDSFNQIFRQLQSGR
jgi:hypothetical protein